MLICHFVANKVLVEPYGKPVGIPWYFRAPQFKLRVTGEGVAKQNWISLGAKVEL